jgi:putative flippase GtrA
MLYNTSSFARLVKYGINGVLVALSQYAAVVALVEGLRLTTSLGKNIAYAASIEVSIIVGFLLYAHVTWRFRFQSGVSYLMKFLVFHLATALSFGIRQVVFY